MGKNGEKIDFPFTEFYLLEDFYIAELRTGCKGCIASIEQYQRLCISFQIAAASK